MKTLEDEMPVLYKQLAGIRNKLEKHYQEMEDIEFTIQQGKLWMLQTRTGKRTAAAAVKIAVDMVKEKLITKKEAVLRVAPEQLDQLLHPTLDPKADKTKLGKGLPASPGAAVGKVVFSAADAETAGGGGAAGDPGAGGDQPGRHPGHERGRGHPDQPGRHDQPRGGGGPGHGQALRGRGRRDRGGLQEGPLHRGQEGGQAGRFHQP